MFRTIIKWLVARPGGRPQNLLDSTYSREPRPELDERRAQPPRLIGRRRGAARETVDLDEDVVARNTLAETNIARSTSRASNDSNRISIASQEDFKF